MKHVKPPARAMGPSLLLAIGLSTGHASAQNDARTELLRIPESIRIEHEEIHAQLVEATTIPGRVGEAARALAEVLDPHFAREEEIALPPLALLAPLAAGDFRPEMREVLPLTDALRSELPHMLEEHEAIAAAALTLEQVAREKGSGSVEALAKALQLHARDEEELFYPAALLVGDVVRARSR